MERSFHEESSVYDAVSDLHNRSRESLNIQSDTLRNGTETWLKSSVCDSVVDIPGYSVLRKDRSTKVMKGSVFI